MNDDLPVLVVGAGPAGLAAALELARRDVPVLLAERRTALSSHPRATVLSLRSMELMRAWGVEPEVRARSVDVDPTMLVAETLADAAAGEVLPVGYPSAEQSRVLSPVSVACVAQDDVEPLLLARLREHPSAEVRLGAEVSVVSAADGVLAAVRDVASGKVSLVHARYAVAADGARSAARAGVGIRMRGEEGVLAGVTTLFRAPLWDVLGPHRHIVYSTPGATLLPAGRGDRWLCGMRDAAEHAVELIRAGAGVPRLPVRLEGARAFSSAAQLADTFRAGPVFLAGDAAHRVTPRGGTGLNLALHDGYDIGWKLAWVLRGWAAAALLDTYEAERRPVAEHTAARSADPTGSIRAPEHEVHADLGGRVAHAWAGERSTLDLLGPGLTLLTSSPWAAPELRVPVDVRRVDPLTARAVGAPGRTALLVRPDGKPAAVLAPDVDPSARLRAALSV